MPQDQQQPGDQSQPTHTAAKVVIPFDIDISEIETKLAAIEQRFANVKNIGESTHQEQIKTQTSKDHDESLDASNQSMMASVMRKLVASEQQTINQKEVKADSVQEQLTSHQSPNSNDFNVKNQFAQQQTKNHYDDISVNKRFSEHPTPDRHNDFGTEKQLMMATMMRMSDLLRQINDTVTLIYNTQMNNNG